MECPGLGPGIFLPALVCAVIGLWYLPPPILKYQSLQKIEVRGGGTLLKLFTKRCGWRKPQVLRLRRQNTPPPLRMTISKVIHLRVIRYKVLILLVVLGSTSVKSSFHKRKTPVDGRGSGLASISILVERG